MHGGIGIAAHEIAVNRLVLRSPSFQTTRPRDSTVTGTSRRVRNPYIVRKLAIVRVQSMKIVSPFLLVLTAVLTVCVLLAGAGEAATKKTKTKAPESEKSVYEQPLRVVIVRNIIGNCEPLCPQWISAEGQITAKSPAVFKKALAKIGDEKLPVVITSPGGDLDAALSIGEMIRKRGLDVAVGGTHFGGCAPYQKTCKLPKEQKGVYRGFVVAGQSFCTSACPLILASGTHRFGGPENYIGVHQISRVITREKVRYLERYLIVNGKKKVLSRKVVSRKPMKSLVSTKIDKQLQKKLTAYLKKMGVEPTLLALFERAPPSSMYRMMGDELRSTKLVTDLTPSADLTQVVRCVAIPPAANCVAVPGVAKP